MQIAVVGAGAWGMPTATELARRGHRVTLLDAHGLGHQQGSSAGATRLWRLSHPDAPRVRLAQHAVAAWRRLEQRSSTKLLLRRGLLWRGDSAASVGEALAEVGVEQTWVAAADVARFFPGLRSNGQDGCWQRDAGPVLASAALATMAELFVADGGTVLTGRWVRAIELPSAGVHLVLSDGSVLAVDAVVVAAGPWTPALLPSLGVELALCPVLEQVAYVEGKPGWEDLPCLYDAPHGNEPGLYAMPTPGLGYKIGVDLPLRDFEPADQDRTPDPEINSGIASRVARDFGQLNPVVVSAQVCAWTDSPDGRFVIDRLHDGRVVLACGDSGEGFKFSALLGERLADLAEGSAGQPDFADFALSRLAGRPIGTRRVLGG